MEHVSYEQRRQSLLHMAEQGVDILVVGGGITGAGVALDAAARGFSTGLVEKADFASGTSSKSTKLVHGGIRYLPQFDFGLVREGLIERGLLARNAPFLVKPLGFVLPLYAGVKRPLGTPIVPPFGIGMSYLLQAGLLLYDLMSGRLGLGRHRRIGSQQALALAPGLKSDGLKDGFIYYDGQTDDTLLTSTVIQTAANLGAKIANYAEVISFEQHNGQIVAARVEDKLSGEQFTIRAGTVINAGGVFAGKIEALTGQQSDLHIQPAKGVHLTVSREALDMRSDAIVLPETEDQRLLFIVPWGPRVTIGTTDTPGGDIEHPDATDADIDYLLRQVNRYMRCTLTRKDIISTWAGYRPLVSSRKAQNTAKVSRTHIVHDSSGGMVTVVGGKLTTFRRMAQDTLDHVCKRLSRPIRHVTEHLPLIGAENWQDAVQAIKDAAPIYGFGEDTIQRLSAYGSQAAAILDLIAADSTLAARVVPDLPYIMAEVVYACRYRMAMQLPDILERRLHLNFEDWDRGVKAAPAVAAVMAHELNWPQSETERQITQYQARFSPTKSHLDLVG
jgi:glycerol-3-phosphate dehydrogenase